MDFNKEILPNENELITENETASVKIMDAELDILACSFNNDSCVQINTEDYTYITLTLDNLETLKGLIYEAEEYYKDVLSLPDSD